MRGGTRRGWRGGREETGRRQKGDGEGTGRGWRGDRGDTRRKRDNRKQRVKGRPSSVLVPSDEGEERSAHTVHDAPH